MGSSSGDDGKIIHVQFGRGDKGKAQGSRKGQGKRRRPVVGEVTEEQALPSEGALEGGSLEPTRDVYTRAEVEKLLGASAARLRALEKNGVVVPSLRRGAHRAYTFQDLIALR
ncbi:MAG: MerR family transcriptional regulator, partial [Polyangiales bacterium]